MSYSSNHHVLIRLVEHWKKILRSEEICGSGVNGLIKNFGLHTQRILDSKNACIGFLNRCYYILLPVFKKDISKNNKDKQ